MAPEPRIDVAPTALSEGQAEPSKAELAEIANSLTPGVWFTSALSGEVAGRAADVTWELTGSPYEGQTATGQAAVYYANPKFGLRKPFLFADGFNYGPSDLPGLFAYFNTVADGGPGLFDQLLSAGYDIVLVGFTERHTHIQANAEVAIAAILRAIAERKGDERLTVGGVSMGGIITRYALAKLETATVDHETATYLSFDSPHNGAWIPLILQQMAYFFEGFTPAGPDGVKQADLIRSPAAQQLLWAWVENSKYEGPVATSSRLRKEFLADLDRVGNFPQIPRKLGVSNGRRDGVGLRCRRARWRSTGRPCSPVPRPASSRTRARSSRSAACTSPSQCAAAPPPRSRRWTPSPAAPWTPSARSRPPSRRRSPRSTAAAPSSRPSARWRWTSTR